MKSQAFFFEAFAEEERALKDRLPDGLRAGFTAATIQETGLDEPPAPLVSIRTQSEIPLDWAARLKGILARTTGYDHLQSYREAAGAEIPCGYLPLYCARSVAEQAMLLWTALLRKLPAQIGHFDHFDRDGLTGSECAGKCLLVVGVGNIGHEVAKLGQVLDMRVLGVDIVRRHADVEYIPLETGLPQANVIVCAMNLTPENRGYFGYETLGRCRPDVVFVNVARGEFSPAPDLLRLLEEGRLGGVGLDVYDREPELAVHLRRGRPAGNEILRAVADLRRRADVILTPHNAFNTHEAVARKTRQSIVQIQTFLDTGRFKWPVPLLP